MVKLENKQHAVLSVNIVVFVCASQGSLILWGWELVYFFLLILVQRCKLVELVDLEEIFNNCEIQHGHVLHLEETRKSSWLCGRRDN